MSTENPTPCKESVTRWPHYIGVKDASSHGIEGIIMGEVKACIPTVFRLTWTKDIKELFHKRYIYKFGFGNGRITNVTASDVGSLSEDTSSLRCVFQ